MKQLDGASNDASQAADRLLNKLGRYRRPAQHAATARLKAQTRR